MNIQQRTAALEGLGEILVNESFESARRKAAQENQWFTEAQTRAAFEAWAEALQPESIASWASRYNLSDSLATGITGIVMAGNIPMVGLHDLLCGVLTGSPMHIRLSSDDKVLLPAVMEKWMARFPELNSLVTFTEQLKGYQRVIATGSNNTARHFQYYFREVPSLIRANRSSAAVLLGNETPADFHLLGADIFTYFGLGCRNVSKLYVPQGFQVAPYYEGIESYHDIINHHKYANNHTYHKALHLMNLSPIYDNDFLILVEHEQVSSPVAVCHYEYYTSEDDLKTKLLRDQDHLQCIVTAAGNNSLVAGTGLEDRIFKFGEAQHPALWDYADGADTVQWLLESL